MLDSSSCTALGRTAVRHGRRRLELPTLGIALAIYAGFFTLTWFFQKLPLPTLPWYRLPRVWREMRASVIQSCGPEAKLVWQGGYLELFRTYLLRPAIPVEHPLMAPDGYTRLGS